MESTPTDLRFREYSRFVGVVTAAHVITYILMGTLTYFLIYKSAMDLGGFDEFMRKPDNPNDWQHVETWLLPAQVLRGLLFGLALCPFLRTLSEWRFRNRFCALLSLLVVFSVWSVTMPGPGSIEGWLYLRPNAGPTLPNPLLGYIEVPTQLALFSVLVSWWIGRLNRKKRGTQPGHGD